MNRLTFGMFTGLLAGLALGTGCGSDSFVDASCGQSGAACEGATGGGSSGHGGESSEGRAGQGGAGAGGKDGSGAGGGGSAGAGGAANVGARVRLAHFAPDGSDLHVCLKSHAEATYENLGERTSISYKQVTTYTTLAAGDYLVRVVDAATTCAAGGGDLIADALPVTLADGDTATLLVREEFLADHTHQLSLSRGVDETAPTAKGGVSWRLLQTAFDAADIDFGYYGAHNATAGDTFFKIFADVTYAGLKAAEGSGQTTAFDPAIDENGYAHLTMPFAAGAAFELRDAKTGDYQSTLVLPAAIAAAHVVTFFAYPASSASEPPALVACADDAAGDGTLAACVYLPADETKKAADAVIRFASLSSDPMLAKVDVCVKPSGSAWSKDNSQTKLSGVTYPSVSANTPLRADSYDIKLFPPGTNDCSSNGFFAKSGVAVTSKTQETWVASGTWTSTTAAFDLRVFANDDTPPPANGTSVRLVNVALAAPRLSELDVVHVSDDPQGAVSTNVGGFQDVPFGRVASGISPQFSNLGYVLLSSNDAGVEEQENLYVLDSDKAEDKAFVVELERKPGHVYTWWVYNYSPPPSSYHVFVCDDTALAMPGALCTGDVSFEE